MSQACARVFIRRQELTHPTAARSAAVFLEEIGLELSTTPVPERLEDQTCSPGHAFPSLARRDGMQIPFTAGKC
jgi:hypothetical protein